MVLTLALHPPTLGDALLKIARQGQGCILPFPRVAVSSSVKWRLQAPTGLS